MNYKELYRKIRIILQKEDPYNLIKMGSPDDEYDEEISNIIIQLKLAANKEDFLIRIENLLTDSFEAQLDNKTMKNLVDQIFEFKDVKAQ